MPNDIEHFEKYRSNKTLLSTDVFNVNETQHLDWVITISFYSALHLVEKKLHEINGTDSQNHQDRKHNILRTRELFPISAQYHALYIQSMRARYDCCEFTTRDVKRAIDLFNEIENVIA